MRRSLRDALIGFSLLSGFVIFSGLSLWLKGTIIGANDWTFTSTFKDASGIAEGSPVTYRGIQVGSVQKITFSPEEVKAIIRINSNKLILIKPIDAKVVTSSVLGGDVQISLISKGDFTKKISFLPKQKECDKSYILCEGDTIKGKDLKNLSEITEEISTLLSQAGGEEIVSKLINSIEQFDETQENLDELILLSKQELKRITPILTDLGETVGHINNIASSIDDPKTTNDLKASISAIKSITENINEIISDEELVNSLKEALVGLGSLFESIY